MKFSTVAITSVLVAACQLSTTSAFTTTCPVRDIFVSNSNSRNALLLENTLPLPSRGLFSSITETDTGSSSTTAKDVESIQETVTVTVTATATAIIVDTGDGSPETIDVNIDSTDVVTGGTVGSDDTITTTTATTGNEEENVYEGFVDEKKLFAESTFPIKPDALMKRAKDVLLNPEIKLGTKDGGECLADDFVFTAAVVGPIPKEEYLAALGSFKLEDAFELTPNYFGMHVDPLQPNRVWYMDRLEGVHVGNFMGAEPTGEKIIYPPQTYHMDFNDDGKLKEIGFYTVDRKQGNTGGLGGAFGFMYGVGKPLPIPECQPYKPSKRFRILSFIGLIGRIFKNGKENNGTK